MRTTKTIFSKATMLLTPIVLILFVCISFWVGVQAAQAKELAQPGIQPKLSMCPQNCQNMTVREPNGLYRGNMCPSTDLAFSNNLDEGYFLANCKRVFEPAITDQLNIRNDVSIDYSLATRMSDTTFLYEWHECSASLYRKSPNGGFNADITCLDSAHICEIGTDGCHSAAGVIFQNSQR